MGTSPPHSKQVGEGRHILFDSERYFAKYTWAASETVPSTDEERGELALQIRKLMDSRKALKPGDPRLAEADRMLDVMRDKSKTSRGLRGRLMTKREAMLESAKVDIVVAEASGVAMLDKVAKLKTAFNN